MKRSKDKYSVSIDEFKLWMEIDAFQSFYFRGHKFEKSKKDFVKIDGGLFTGKEAIQLFKMILSSNPFTRFEATLIIWGRNGALTRILVILGLLFLLLIFIIVER